MRTEGPAHIEDDHMKTIVCIAAFLTLAGANVVAEQTWTGTITDTMCAVTHQSNIEHARERSGKTMTNQECTVGCVMHRGQKYVLVSEGKTYQIENQDYADLPTHAARAVRMTGTLAGNTIKISRIAATEAAKTK